MDGGVRKLVHTDRVSNQNKISLKSMYGENSTMICFVPYTFQLVVDSKTPLLVLTWNGRSRFTELS